MENKRIVCVVVERSDGVFRAIDGQEFINRFLHTLQAYGFTVEGVGDALEPMLGNEPIPISALNVDAMNDEEKQRLRAKLAGRAATIRRLQVVWDMAEIVFDHTATLEERWAALDTIQDAVHPGPVADLEEGLLPEE